MEFLLPFVFSDVLDLPRDLYYWIYAASVIACFGLWAHSSGQPLGEMLRRRWRLAVVLGGVCAVVLAVVVFRTEARRQGLEDLRLLGR